MKAKEEIRKRLKELELELNSVCYDDDLIPTLYPLWKKLESLQEYVETIENKENDYDGNKEYDSQKCEKCGCRTALITGIFCYDPDDEPYNNDVKEEAKVESGECWVGGFKCDNCGHIQGLWSE